MAKKLIVNADDFGRSAGVSRGILHAHETGIVTSTTVMINQPDIEEQLAGALKHTTLGIGLHLVFSAWRPLLAPEAVPGLVDESGMFLDQHTLWARAEQTPLDQLHAELLAQIEKFEALAGRPPDHLDCHHFVHLYPGFFRVYADLGARANLPLRVPFPPAPDFAKAVKTLPFLEGFPPDLVRGMIATDSALIKARGLRHPDHFVGTFFGREALTMATLNHLLDTLPDGVTELMCHPGYADPSLAESSYREEREIEVALLTDPAIRDRVEHLGIELVTFDILAS
jgi:predicted glycoside hydrolase/deacetylase ChbG (UPF0249 family)